MRTFKDPNDANTYADPERGLLGHEQREWLIRGLRSSRATWKVIANDLPLGLVVPDGPAAQEGVAQGDPGPPKGRELEFAQVLRSAHRAGVTGIACRRLPAFRRGPDRRPDGRLPGGSARPGRRLAVEYHPAGPAEQMTPGIVV